ncbi:hypothetical protein [Ursidibacter sp. B-7004-1]
MKLKQTFGILTLSSAIALSGCSNMPGSSSSSLSGGDDAEFFSSSGWGSCAIGALGGAILGAGGTLLAGGSTESAIIGGVAGGLAGCGAAMTADYYLEKQRKTYARKEDRLNAYIADIRKNSQMVAKSTAKLQSQTNKNNSLIKTLNAQLKAGTIKREDAKKQLAQIDKDIEAAQNRLKGMKSNFAVLNGAAKEEKKAGTRSKALDRDIAQLNKQIATYEKILNAQVKQRSAIQVG